jgi:HEPN domain-containing protein
MSDPEHARLLLEMAGKDFRALQGMMDAEIFADSIFSFHAQQAVEKVLKAWCSLKGIRYPRTHDIERLFQLIEAGGVEVPEGFISLVGLTDFAVQYRYESTDVGLGPVAREEILGNTGRFLRHVAGLMAEASKPGTA